MPNYGVESPSPFTQALIDSRDANPSSRFNGMNVYVSDYCPICHRALDSEGSESETLANILAKRIVTDPERRFITDEQLAQLDIINKSYMNVSIYDTDRNGIVDLSERSMVADSVDWENVKNRPNLTIAMADELIASMHKHTNKVAIDNIGIDTNRNLPLWGGLEWPTNTTAKDMPLNSKSIRNTYITPDMPSNSTIGDLWLEIERTSNGIRGIHINKGGNQWIDLSINTLSDIIRDRVVDAIIAGGGVNPGTGGSSVGTFTRTFSGTGIDKEFTILHNLGSVKIFAQLLDSATNEDVVAHFIRNSENSIIVSFRKAPLPTEQFTLLLVKC